MTKRPLPTMLAGVLLVSLLGNTSLARVFEVEPGEDYRPIFEQLEPGDEVVFLPGVHEQHATFDLKGTADAPIVLHGELGDDGERPEIRWTERGNNTWGVSGEHLHIRDLAFHNTNHYGLRVFTGAHITIENCLFRENGGGDLSANSRDVHALHVLDSRFIGGRRTPVYIGNQRGTITVDDFRFERNVIDGSEITGGGIGYGIQLKLNVDGVVRDNFVRGTMGPGIMVYGFEDPDTEYRQLVERNIVVGSRNNPNIIVGGGPATARHNLALGSRSGGISVINYGGRGYVHHVTVTENISAANRGTDLNVHSTATYLVATGNRVYTAPDRPGIGNLPTDGNEVAGNHEAPANDALLEVIAQLRDTVPCNDSVRQATQSLEGGVPANQTELVKLLQTLLGS